MSELLTQLRAFVERLEPARRKTLGAAVAASLAVVAGVGVWAAQPDYVVLTRAGDADEAGAITRSLAQAGIPFDLDGDGVTVRVLAASEVDARRAASSEDGIVGLEGLEQIDPWVTPFQEQLHRQRMLQGELVRTINALAGIAASTVQLNLPERSAFLRADERATAAVTLRPDAGASVGPTTARSVAELVSHAVAGMTAEDVTVVDASTGRLLWSGGSAGAAEEPSTQNASAREAALAAGVRSALHALLGTPDAATVTVHVELESAAVQTTENRVDPDSAVAATERLETEANATASAVPTGVPGTESNTPERANASGGASAGRSRDVSQTTYEYSKTVTTTVKPAGDLKRVSSAVMIDTAALKTLVARAGEGADEAAIRKDIESAVRASLGFDAERGDQVVVSFVAFAPTAMSEAEAVPSVPAWERLAAPAVAALAVLLAFLFVVRPLVQAARPAPTVAANRPMPAAARAEDEEDEDARPANVEDLSARLRRQVERFQALEPKDVSDLVRQESDHSAEVVRRWIRS